jgi:hypothetical protein
MVTKESTSSQNDKKILPQRRNEREKHQAYFFKALRKPSRLSRLGRTKVCF